MNNSDKMILTGIDFLDKAINTYNEGFRTIEFPLAPMIDSETEVMVGKIPDFIASMMLASINIGGELINIDDVLSTDYIKLQEIRVRLGRLIEQSIQEVFKKFSTCLYLELRSGNVIVEVDVEKLIIQKLGMPEKIKENGALSAFIDGIINFYNSRYISIVPLIQQNKGIFAESYLNEVDWKSIDESTDVYTMVNKFHEFRFAGIDGMDIIIGNAIFKFEMENSKLKKIFSTADLKKNKSFDSTGPEIIDDDESH